MTLVPASFAALAAFAAIMVRVLGQIFSVELAITAAQKKKSLEQAKLQGKLQVTVTSYYCALIS